VLMEDSGDEMVEAVEGGVVGCKYNWGWNWWLNLGRS